METTNAISYQTNCNIVMVSFTSNTNTVLVHFMHSLARFFTKFLFPGFSPVVRSDPGEPGRIRLSGVAGVDTPVPLTPQHQT